LFRVAAFDGEQGLAEAFGSGLRMFVGTLLYALLKERLGFF
jgi:hypothetical protein